MLSFYITASLYVFGYLMTITSGSCPYVANYYYSGYTLGCGADSCSSQGSGGAFSIGTCQPYEYEGTAEKFVCINDAVYVNIYDNLNCDGQSAESHEVLAVSEEDPENSRAAYQYSCDDTGCTNYAKVLVSQSSYDALVEASENEQPFPQCTDPGSDHWFDLYGMKFITNVCVDSTGNATEPESSMKFACDGGTFTLYRYTNDRTCSNTPEIETHSFPGCTEMASGVEVWATLICAETGTNTDLLPTPEPTARPTTPTPTTSPSDVTIHPTASPSNDPTQSSGAPSAAPSALTGEPTPSPSKAPSTDTVGPSVSPSSSPVESYDERGAAMILRCA
eukprot:181169_1